MQIQPKWHVNKSNQMSSVFFHAQLQLDINPEQMTNIIN